MSLDNNGSSSEQKTKKKSQFVRILILVFIFCTMVVIALVVSDVFLPNEKDENTEPVLVAVSVLSDHLLLDNGKEVSISELRVYMDDLKVSGKPFVGSIINDMANPADVTLYNEVVDLFAEYDIFCEKLTNPSSSDELLMVEITE